MKLCGEHTITVTDTANGKVVFAKSYDTWWQRDRALVKSIGPRYADKRFGDRYFIQIGILSESLPSLAGHPPENIARLAEQRQVPVEMLLYAQSIEEHRIRHFNERLKFIATKYGHLIAAILLTLAASVLVYESRRQTYFLGPPFNELALLALALALVSYLAALWCLWRHSGDWTYVAMVGFILFLAALLSDGIVGPFFGDLIRNWFSAR